MYFISVARMRVCTWMTVQWMRLGLNLKDETERERKRVLGEEGGGILGGEMERERGGDFVSGIMKEGGGVEEERERNRDKEGDSKWNGGGYFT